MENIWDIICIGAGSAGLPLAIQVAKKMLGFGNSSGHGFVGGMSLTPALTFGKILGENILK